MTPPMTLHVRLLVGRSAKISEKRGKLHFHGIRIQVSINVFLIQCTPVFLKKPFGQTKKTENKTKQNKTKRKDSPIFARTNECVIST